MRSHGRVRAFYNTQAWKQCRAAYWQAKGGLCERCLSFGLYTPGAEVHHKIHLTDDNVGDSSVALSWDNLELLCEACHHAEHDPTHRIKPGRRRWELDEQGQVLLP